jgi:hypothetical protein
VRFAGTARMGSLHDDIISGVIGAVSGGVFGALTGLATGFLVAPSQSEREERGKRRLEGRSQIASAATRLNYQLMEARERLFRLEETGNLLDRARFLEFAGSVRKGAMFLRWFARYRVERRAKKLTGRLIWRLSELVPEEHYSDVDQASITQATADTRTSTDKRVYGTRLAHFLPTSPEWDEALKILGKLRRAYPG